MVTLLLAAALTQVPVEIHSNGTAEARMLLRSLHCDIPCVCEDTRAIRHVQDELRRIIVVRESLDVFVMVGRHKTRFEFPSPVYDSPVYTVLCIQREINQFNRPRRVYNAGDVYQDVRFAGIVNLGDEGLEESPLPQPWQEDFQLTAWRAPEIEK